MARTVRVWMWGFAPVFLAAAAWGAWQERHHRAGRAAAELADFGPAPAFQLIDQQGRPFDSGRLRGRVWIAEFIFTRCAGQCPLLTGKMAALQAALTGEPDVRLVSITVDPAYDRPERLAAYAAHYGAQEGRWVFLTGETAEIERLAREGFRLAYAEGGEEAEPIIHSARLVLVDQAGRLRAYVDARDADAVDRLRAATVRLLGGR